MLFILLVGDVYIFTRWGDAEDCTGIRGKYGTVVISVGLN